MRSRMRWKAGPPVVSPSAATKSARAGLMKAPTAEPTATAACSQGLKTVMGVGVGS